MREAGLEAELKEDKARQRKLEKTLADSEKRISETEARLKEIEAEMSDEATMSDHQRLSGLVSEQEGLHTLLDELYETWQECTEALGL
ncbi:MAG: hypothetical protein HGA22_07015 [Clostridiales bacterium]|nr:hypothetical protein [Clostridiales bacterium]